MTRRSFVLLVAALVVSSLSLQAGSGVGQNVTQIVR